jgi:hypothetical protein
VPAEQAYVNVRDEVSEEAATCKRFTEELWSQFQSYADADFVTAMPTAFHARFWEMYLTCALLDEASKRGYVLTCPKPGPDILLTHGNRRIWFEAIIATNGKAGKPDALTEPANLEGMKVAAGTVPSDRIILRYTAAIAEKQRKYAEYHKKGIVREGDSCVIAVNGRDMAYAWADGEIPRILKAIYPMGPWGIALDPKTLEVVDQKHQYRPQIMRTAGAPVSTTLFVEQENSGISAILSSNAYAWMTRRPLGVDFLLAYNPNAASPIPRGLVRAAREWWGIRKEDGAYELACEDGRMTA